MTFVNAEAPGITILPTHRVAFHLKNFSIDGFTARAEEYFTVASLAAGLSAADLLKKLNETKDVAFIASTRDKDFLLTPKPDAIAPLLSGLTPEKQQLDVTQLHKVVLEKVLDLDEETVRAGDNIKYLREASEAVDEARSGKADVAFLIKPVTLQQMKDISLNMDVMPQKSTDFYPKLLSGLAMYALD
jgi:uncharacterized protein (DUF1015 family)